MNIDSLWAKTNPREPLPHHMKAVGDTAIRILTNSAYDELLNNMCKWSGLDKETIINAVRYIAAMHDIGKVHPSFQCKDGNPLPEGYEDNIIPHFRHERVILEIAPILWKDWDSRTRRFFSAVLSLHHQHGNKNEPLPKNKKWESLWFDIEYEIRKWAKYENISVRNFPNADAFCTVLTGLIIISDWIASSQDADEAFKAMRFEHHDNLKSFDFEEMFGYKPRYLQQKVIDKVNDMDEMPLLMTIEAPPGEGKTELAIWLAHKMGEYWNKNGIYFGLPTAATSNQMIDRVQTYLKDDVALMHSMEWLQDRETDLSEEEKQIRNEWKNPIKRGLLSRYAVGTVDQIMLSVLKVRYGALRLFGLSNKVVIIDEIHAYDAYMTEVIKRMVEWLNALNIPVIMLSATLPAERKKTLLEIEKPISKYPLITSIFKDKRTEQFTVDKVYRHMSAKIELVKGFDNIEIPNGMGCIIVNTVSKAQEIYDKIKGPKILFHSRFPAELRAEIEQKVLRKYSKDGKRENFVLVATQVVEQSLDVDFDWLITELAPIDLIHQRLGRVQRHEIPGRGQPKCFIFYEEEYGLKYGKSEYVYQPLLLERTKKLLDGVSEIKIPDDIRHMIETVYSRDMDANELEAFLSRNQEIAFQQGEARVSILNKPSKRSFCLEENFVLSDDGEAARTRLGAGYKLCILPQDLYDIAVSGKATAAEAKKISGYCIPTIQKYDGVDGTGKFYGYRFRVGTANSPLKTSYSTEYKDKLIMHEEKGLCLM